MKMEGFEFIDAQIQGLIKKISIFKKDGKQLTVFDALGIKTHIHQIMTYVRKSTGPILTRQQSDYLKDTLKQLMHDVDEVTEGWEDELTEGVEPELPKKKSSRRLRKKTNLGN